MVQAEPDSGDFSSASVARFAGGLRALAAQGGLTSSRFVNNQQIYVDDKQPLHLVQQPECMDGAVS